MSNENSFDVAIVGGGLAGCLMLHALRRFQPQLRIILIEKNNSLCGSHTWSLHLSDIPASLQDLLTPLFSVQWDAYEVKFPSHQRTLNSAYASIRSTDLAKKTWALANDMTHILTGVEIQRFDQHWVDSHNQRYNAHWVIDATGWGKIAGPLGYQKFFGMEVELENPHQLQNPILKDARIPQTDGYRFMYSLPMSASSLLIEDTYYSNTPHLHIQQWRQEVIEYCQKHFGKIKSVTHEEIGCLPLALTAQLDNPLKIIHLGAASGFYQPITGYSLPQTLRMMELIIAGIGKGLTNTQIIAEQKSYIKNWQPQLNYLLWLNRMLFIAAEPEKRYLILERFYRLQPQLVHRFYRGELTTFDKIRILFGKPPVSIRKALKAFWT